MMNMTLSSQVVRQTFPYILQTICSAGITFSNLNYAASVSFKFRVFELTLCRRNSRFGSSKPPHGIRKVLCTRTGSRNQPRASPGVRVTRRQSVPQGQLDRLGLPYHSARALEQPY